MSTRWPLVLIPQHFGCLVFERRTSRYLPFDREATDLLLALHRQPINAILADIADPEEQQAIGGFYRCFEQRGFFTLGGQLAADVLSVTVPPDHLVGPLAVHLEIVAACNLTCTHCFAGVLPRHHHPLLLPELDHLFRDLASIGSLRLGLTGGEPLLRKDIFEILDCATGHGLHPCLTTNALLLSEEAAREFGRRELVWLNVSLEGPDATSNDAIRGAGTFNGVLEKLKLLSRHARFTLAFTITNRNAHLVRDCVRLAYEVGAHTAVFRPLYPAGMALEHLDLMPTFAQYTQALHELAIMDTPGADLNGLDPFSPLTRAPTEPQLHTSHTCGAGQHVCSISVQGDVNPCSFLGDDFNTGNIREKPFPEIWRTGQQMRRLRESTGGFAGGCRARSLTFAGSVDAPDPWYEEFRTGEGLHPGTNVELSACGWKGVALPVVDGSPLSLRGREE